MPSGPPELHEKWGSDSAAIKHLEDRGWKLNRNWTWTPPDEKAVADKETMSAVWYLHLEWDFGGLEFSL